MVSLWPWRSQHKRIQDLTASELSSAALSILHQLGKNTRSLRLIYRALELDPYYPQALLLMSELYRGKIKGVRPQGD